MTRSSSHPILVGFVSFRGFIGCSHEYIPFTPTPYQLTIGPLPGTRKQALIANEVVSDLALKLFLITPLLSQIFLSTSFAGLVLQQQTLRESGE